MKLNLKVLGLGAILGVLAVGAPGCGGTGTGGGTGVGDGGGDTDAGSGDMDAGTDAGSGGGADAGSGDTDAGTDAGSGGGADAGSGDMDAGPDAGSGGGTDAGSGAMDAGMDAGNGGGGGADVNAQLAAIRDAADTGDAGQISLPITGALVTYLKPLAPDAGSSDPAGFFLQGSATGPALFVAIDPSTLAGGLAVGDLVSLTVDSAARTSGLRRATAVSGVSIGSRGNPVSGFAQSVSNVDFTTSVNVDTWESRLVSVMGTVSNEPASAGTGFKSAALNTMGTPDGGSILSLRLPSAVMDGQALGLACTVSLNGQPLWRFNSQAQPSAFASSELSNVVCPGPALVSASASSPTQVTATFSRDLSATTVAAGVFSITDGSGLTVSNAVLSGPRSVTLTTSNQTNMQHYSLTAGSALTDMRGTACVGNSVTFTGVGSPQCAPSVVISAVFGGYNSATGAAFLQNFVELHNRTNAPVSLAGWSIRYANPTASTWQSKSLTGTIAAGGYFLLRFSNTLGMGPSTPTPDLAIDGMSLGASNGKVALMNTTAPLSGSCLTTGVVDFFGYGTANCAEGNAAVQGLSSTTMASRKDALGATQACVDTNNNAADFTVGAATAPRNSMSQANTCTCP